MFSHPEIILIGYTVENHTPQEETRMSDFSGHVKSVDDQTSLFRWAGPLTSLSIS